MVKLIIGMGEIGSAVCELIKKNTKYKVCGLDNDKTKCVGEIDERVDIIHICFPEKNLVDFCLNINDYWNRFKPISIIIHSTISLRTAELLEKFELLNCSLYHVPVRGKHENIFEDLQKFPLFIGEAIRSENNFDVAKYLMLIFNVDIYRGMTIMETALAKLQAVVWTGLNIAFAQQIKLICDEYGIDFHFAYTEFTKTSKTGIYEYNKDRAVRTKILDRPVFYPSYIGGKCVIQDTELLKPQAKEMCEWIIKTNEKFKNDKMS